MSTYADFISKLRSDVQDFATRRYETADGDGATTVFQLANPKILESSYTVKVGGTTQTESTDYTKDANVAQVIFESGSIPASGNDNISFEYQSVNQTDADWIDIINSVLNDLRRKLWKEITDESTLSTVKDQDDYDLSGVAGDVVYLIEVQYRVNSSSPWISLSSDSNVIFFRDLQKFNIKPTFSITGYELRLRVCRAYTQATTSAGTFEPPDKFWSVIRAFCKVKYYERMAAKQLAETSAVSKEKSFESGTALLQLARIARKDAEEMLKTVRPKIPAKRIPNAIE